MTITLKWLKRTKSQKKRENPVAAVLSCSRIMAYKREGADVHSHLWSANRNREMGREAQCVDTIDFFLTQPARSVCQARSMAIRDVWIKKKFRLCIWDMNKSKSGLKKKTRGSREYFLQTFGRKPVRNAKMWHCTKGKQVPRNFPERLHK